MSATPSLCLDLSHYSLRWFNKAKRKNVLELRSDTQGIDLNLHWPGSDFDEASSWFHSLKAFTTSFDGGSKKHSVAQGVVSAAAPAAIGTTPEEPPAIGNSSR